ncbi:unnamed protein product, partial [Mesorhabditis belari]|uniref:Peptidase C1A papain C-terminal domain-containing protein n=1 Tax=Mesorhabditis belari TaxID=2138241 RepID=A0AAF3FCG8_9BILA
MRLSFLFLFFGIFLILVTASEDNETSEERDAKSNEVDNDASTSIEDEEYDEDDDESNPFSFDEDDEDEDKEVDEIVDSKPIDYEGDPIGEWDEEEPLEPLELDSEDEEELGDDKDDFIEFHKTFKENVKKAEMKQTVQNFKINNKELKELQQEKKNFKIGKSPFMYMSQKEIDGLFAPDSMFENRPKPTKMLKSGLKVVKNEHKRSTRGARRQPRRRTRKVKLPKNFDWRTKNVLSPIRDQGSCGSCWAFSATAPIEVAYARKYKKKIDLSEEQLQCVYNEGTMCTGGHPETALNYLLNSKGQATEKSIPYKGCRNSTCRRNINVAAQLESFATLMPFQMAKVKHALIKNGPISFGMLVNQDFQFYESGIFDAPCTSADEGGHAMTIVGYGEENGTPYWIVRNQWGKDWGEKGHIRVKAGVNLCGIESRYMYQVAVK